MHAITLTEFGSPDVMQWTEVPDPRPQRGQVIVDVAATAVNRADLMQRQGVYPPPPGASEILGLECSGVISELGEGVHGWRVGDRVLCRRHSCSPSREPSICTRQRHFPRSRRRCGRTS